MILPRVSIVLPVYNEGEALAPTLKRLRELVEIDFELLVIFDSLDDTTIPTIQYFANLDNRVRPVHNTFGPGPANAIRFGMTQATAPVIVVTMADGCDDAAQIDTLARLVERGVVVACASRYARGGQQVGGPLLKGLMSRVAGLTLYWFARVGTRDATNSFKAYSTSFVNRVGVESDQGFEIGIELVAKARRNRLPVAEIPTIWLDRSFGVSNFKLWLWVPRYLKWYFHSFGRSKKLDKSR